MRGAGIEISRPLTKQICIIFIFRIFNPKHTTNQVVLASAPERSGSVLRHHRHRGGEGKEDELGLRALQANQHVALPLR